MKKKLVVENDIAVASYDSFDNIVDSYLMDFEKESQAQVERFSLKAAMPMLFEDEDESSGDMGQPSPRSIDMKTFATKLARLIKNSENMIDPKIIILNRAKKFINSNYGPKSQQELDDILKRHFGLSTADTYDTINSAPPAKGAGPDVGGSGGGI